LSIAKGVSKGYTKNKFAPKKGLYRGDIEK
jgi:hypothetical protein